MGRIARVVVPDTAHHLTQRGNHQQDVFFQDRDREMYLRILGDNCPRAGLRILAYCLMSNHVHLVAVPEREDSLAKGLGLTNNEYARWLHVRERQSGHLWQNRFFSCPLDERHLQEALRYVELNPVRAGLARYAWDWPWSSAAAHVSGEAPAELLDLAWWRTRYDARNWHEILEFGVEEVELRERLREATRTGRPFGTAAFAGGLEAQLGRPLRPRKRGPKPSADCLEAQLSFEVV